MYKLRYLILPNKKLILEYYCGDFNVDKLIDFKKKIGNDIDYNPNYDVISDIRDLTFLFKINEVKKYVQFISKNPKHKGNRKTAMITRTPNQVVTSLNFNFLKSNLPIEFKVFSTFKAAYNFIGLSMNDAELCDNLFSNF